MEKKIDWLITLLPLCLVILLCIIFFLWPSLSNEMLSNIRFFFGDTLGVWFLIVGLFIFILSLYIAFSKYGNIVLGEKNEKPKYSFFTWGSMMFTCGLAADILFYSFSEWIICANDPYILSLGEKSEWTMVFPIFHWSLIPWSFYMVLAIAFGFMLHVRKSKRQRYSESCKAIIGKQSEGILGRFIDLLAVFALIAGTATTFSVATPLMAEIISELFNVNIDRNIINLIILLITCFIYTYSLLHGIKGIGLLANLCMYLFFILLAIVLLFGGQTGFIIENGLSSIGKMLNNFIELATYSDPLRETSFPQNQTIYYWAYWLVWCVAAPFFIGNISKGRTIKQTILGGYLFGAGSTVLSFIILGNYSLGLELKNNVGFIASYVAGNDLYKIIVSIIKTLPFSNIMMFLVLVTMILFYATSFDSIALTAATYSYKELKDNEGPSKLMELMWCILLILLPIALLFLNSSLNCLQSIAIVAAFPISIVVVLIIFSFLKDGKRYLDNK